MLWLSVKIFMENSKAYLFITRRIDIMQLVNNNDREGIIIQNK